MAELFKSRVPSLFLCLLTPNFMQKIKKGSGASSNKSASETNEQTNNEQGWIHRTLPIWNIWNIIRKMGSSWTRSFLVIRPKKKKCLRRCGWAKKISPGRPELRFSSKGNLQNIHWTGYPNTHYRVEQLSKNAEEGRRWWKVGGYPLGVVMQTALRFPDVYQL